MTSAIRVNIDYESVLFNDRHSSSLNEAFEFLALYLEDRPLLTRKKYSAQFLEHVEGFTGRRPAVVQSGAAENWWGRLENPDLERRLNSKVTCLEVLHRLGENKGAQVVHRWSDIDLEQLASRVLIKADFGMSGRGNLVRESSKLTEDELAKWLQAGPVILEPLRDRVFDFSTYVFNLQDVVTYQNLVDESFHYKGTIINRSDLTVQGLSFFTQLPPEEWEKFCKIRDQVIAYYFDQGNRGDFCLDSFIYKTGSGLRIYPVCEVNYRRSMGSVAYQLTRRFTKCRYGLMLFGKSQKSSGGFPFVSSRILGLENTFYLSPGDTRFEVFFLAADSLSELRQSYHRLKGLLPGCEFAVDF